MGGRGASSGISNKGKKYGTQYKTLLADGNELKSITYFDKDNKRVKSINLDHKHAEMQPHTHHGYFHSENDGKKGASNLTPKERKMVDNVKTIWDNYNNGK